MIYSLQNALQTTQKLFQKPQDLKRKSKFGIKCVLDFSSMYVWNNFHYVWFQGSAAKWMRTALFWVIMQQVVIILYWHFGTTYQSHLQGPRKQKDPWRWDWNISNNYHYSCKKPEKHSSKVLLQQTLRKSCCMTMLPVQL